MKRKVIRIHYEGYEVPADPPEKSEKKSKKKKKGATKEIIDEKNEKKVYCSLPYSSLPYSSLQVEREKMAAAATANALAQAAGQPQPFPHVQPIVYIVYQGLPPKGKRRKGEEWKYGREVSMTDCIPCRGTGGQVNNK